MLNAILGAAVMAFVLLMVFACWLVVRGMREFAASINGLTLILKPLLANTQVATLLDALPRLMADVAVIAQGLAALNATLKVFNQAMLSKEAMAAAPPPPPDEDGLVVPYDEGIAAENNEELLRKMMKLPQT